MAQDGQETGFRYQQPLLLVSVRPQTGCGITGDLTDKELKNLKPRAKLYQEVLTIGRYSAEAARKLTWAPGALEYGMEVSLAEAGALLARARR